MSKSKPSTREPTLTFAIITGEGENERILGETIDQHEAGRWLLEFKKMGVYKDVRVVAMPLEEATKWLRKQMAKEGVK
jgi:hypothetical protein